MALMEIIITAILVSIMWYLYHKHQMDNFSKKINALNHDVNNATVNREYEINKKVIEKSEELNNQILELRKQLVDVERASYEKGKKMAEDNFAKDFLVQVFPYQRHFKEKKDKLLAFGETEKVEIGYQYQFFVKGAPAFKPEIVVLETHDLKNFKLNKEAISTLVNTAIGDKSEIAGGVINIAKDVLLKK
ncbi:hypothetical protein [Hanstruepera ponticola]|uniref:hypothetical protein n=1 Tax=Hanstruepera ponticola TaxID=2042995 RepID=UPI00177FA5A7|nr:hypothetical protein [Hanstruepera ponticola]